jgi:hypothetical protein
LELSWVPWASDESFEPGSNPFGFPRSGPRAFTGADWIVDRVASFWPDFPRHMERADFTTESKCGLRLMEASQRGRHLDVSSVKGAPLSGTWNADFPSFNGNTIEGMLERTAERDVAGS